MKSQSQPCTDLVQDPPCFFQACHGCRPWLQERSYASIDAAFDDFLPSMTPAEAAWLHVIDARTLRNMTLPGDHSHKFTTNASASVQTVHTFHDTQVLERNRNPRNRFYMLDNRSSASISRAIKTNTGRWHALCQTIKGIFKGTARSTSTPRPGDSFITLPVSRTGTARKLTAKEAGEPVLEFDLGILRRVRRQRERWFPAERFETVPRRLFNKGARCSVEEPRAEDTDGTDAAGAHASGTTAGGEVEVDGGVALTEEAVATHTPDILLDYSAAADGDVEMMNVDSTIAQR